MQIVHSKEYYKVRDFKDLRQMLAQSVGLFPDKPAFKYRINPDAPVETVTFSEFHDHTKAFGTELAAMGQKDHRIAVIGENRYEWCVAHVAIVNGLGVSVPLDRMLPEGEVFGLLERGEVSAVVYSPSFHRMMRVAAEKLPSIQHFICMDASRVKEGLSDFTPDGRFQDMQVILERGAARVLEGDRTYLDASIDPHSMIALLFTSGTTSASKAVMLSHTNICADIRGMCTVMDLQPGHRMLSVLPLHHTFENTCGLMTALCIGACVHEFDGLRYIQKNMQEYRITLQIGVPILFENFYTKVQDTLKKTNKLKTVHIAIRISRFLRLFGIDVRRKLFKQILDAFGGDIRIGICGAAPIDPVIIRFFDDIGFTINQGYGLTETSPVVAGCNTRVFYPGSVGNPIGGVDIAIDTDEPLGQGEILVRGPIVMQGYYQDEKATSEVMDGEWFRTGDIGRLDRMGRLFITGRIKSMIVLPNGKKIFPEEIEQLIGHAAYVKESMVWGELRKDGEVEVCARFVLNKDAILETLGGKLDDLEIRKTLENLVKEINSRLPSFKAIRYFVFGFNEMVKTTTLKIKRPVEISRIQDLMNQASMQLRELTGRNIDPMIDMKNG